MIQQRLPLFLGFTIAICSAAFLSGCGKKATETAPAVDTNAAAAAIAEPAPAPAPAPAPTTVSPGQASYEAAQAAVKQKDYDHAAEIMLALQQQMRQAKTPDEANAIANQMRNFQQQLMSAASAGDPKAMAAVQRLRQASTPH
jgi:hypothetical protein